MQMTYLAIYIEQYILLTPLLLLYGIYSYGTNYTTIGKVFSIYSAQGLSTSQTALVGSTPQTGNSTGDRSLRSPCSNASLLSAPINTTRIFFALFITGNDSVIDAGTFYPTNKQFIREYFNNTYIEI